MAAGYRPIPPFTSAFAATTLCLCALLLVVAFYPLNAFSEPQRRTAPTKVNLHDGLTYVWIAPGTFTMGCSPGDGECHANEIPAHTVTLTSGFWIGQAPVTQAAYKKVVGANPSHIQGETLPVDSVSWDDAANYCEAVSMRLPTEAEWEYAARGGNPTPRYGPALLIAWFGANSGGSTQPVGQKRANALGLYDMLGNVWEWVADRYGPFTAAPVQDPTGPTAGAERVLRGLSWIGAPSNVRVSYRNGGPQSTGNPYGGFRCAGN